MLAYSRSKWLESLESKGYNSNLWGYIKIFPSKFWGVSHLKIWILSLNLDKHTSLSFSLSAAHFADFHWPFAGQFSTNLHRAGLLQVVLKAIVASVSLEHRWSSSIQANSFSGSSNGSHASELSSCPAVRRCSLVFQASWPASLAWGCGGWRSSKQPPDSSFSLDFA